MVDHAIPEGALNLQVGPWLEQHRGVLQITTTTVTPGGQTLDWVPIESQISDTIAEPPPAVAQDVQRTRVIRENMAVRDDMAVREDMAVRDDSAVRDDMAVRDDSAVRENVSLSRDLTALRPRASVHVLHHQRVLPGWQ